jgi:4'-phosphopantetheinyl transferase
MTARPCSSGDALLWPEGPSHPQLRTGEVHVWLADLDQYPPVPANLISLLTDDERHRASGFRFRGDADRFIAARAVLRMLLGRYTGTAPARIRFSYNAHGKPSLDDSGSLKFNLSHSHRLALYAVAFGPEVGIDLEWVRPEFAGLDVAARFMSRSDVDLLRSLPPDARVEEFFDRWVRTEARVKARGESLATSIETASTAETVSAPEWSMVELHPGDNYRAALAIAGGMPALCCWQWRMPGR